MQPTTGCIILIMVHDLLCFTEHRLTSVSVDVNRCLISRVLING